MRKLLIPIMVLAAGAAGMVPLAGAGAGERPVPMDDLDVELLSNVEPLRFGLGIDPILADCGEGTFEVLSVEVQAYEAGPVVAVTPISVTEDPTDPNQAEMVLPSDTPGGALIVQATCDNVEGDYVEGGVLFASLGITKVVDGPAPGDAAFTVRVDCSDSDSESLASAWSGVGAQEVGDTFVVDLLFSAAGGTKYVYMDSGGLCLITEPENGGADSVTVSNDIDTGPAPASYTSIVTNTFAAAIAPNFTG